MAEGAHPLLCCLLPAGLLNESQGAASRSEHTCNTITGCPLTFPLCPSQIHYGLHRPNLSSDLRAHLDGHAASCQANQGGCAALCSRCDVESVKGNNEPSPASDPQLMLHLLPHKHQCQRTRTLVSHNNLTSPAGIIANEVALEITSCLGSPVSHYITEVRG